MKVIFMTVLATSFIMATNSRESVSTEMGSWGAGAYLDVSVHQDNAYVAAGHGGLDILKFDQNQPYRTASLNLPDGAWQLTATNDLVYVAAGEQGLIVVDASDPYAPQILRQYPTQDYAMDVAIHDGRALVADRTAGLTLIPLNGSVRSVSQQIPLAGVASRVCVDGDLALVSAGPAGVFVVDLAGTQPRVVAQYDAIMAEDAYLENGMAVIASANEGVHLMDLSQPGAPRLLQQLRTKTRIAAVAPWGDSVLAVDEEAGLWQFPLRGSRSTQVQQLSAQLGHASGLAVFNDLALVASSFDGLLAVDLLEPEQITRFDQSAYMYDVHVHNQYALLSDPGSQRMEVLDVSDPQFPQWVTGVQLDSYTTDVIADGEIFYIGMGTEGLAVHNTMLDETTSINVGGPVEDLFQTDNLLFVAAREAGLRILDCSNPDAVQIVGSLQTPGRAVKVIVHQDMALVADEDEGLQVIDISEPSRPVLISNFQTGGLVNSVTTQDDLVFLADAWAGLIVLDLSDPSQPQLVTHQNMDQPATDVQVADDHIYVTGGYGSLTTFGMTPFGQLNLLRTQTTPGSANALSIEDGTVFIADGLSGKLITMPLD